MTQLRYKPAEKTTNYLSVLTDTVVGVQVHWSKETSRMQVCPGPNVCQACQEGDRPNWRFTCAVVVYDLTKPPELKAKASVWTFGAKTYEQLRELPRSSGGELHLSLVVQDLRFARYTFGLVPELEAIHRPESFEKDLSEAKNMCDMWKTAKKSQKITKGYLLSLIEDGDKLPIPVQEARYATLMSLLMEQ